MVTTLIFLVPVVVSITAVPLQKPIDNRLSGRIQDVTLPTTLETKDDFNEDVISRNTKEISMQYTKKEEDHEDITKNTKKSDLLLPIDQHADLPEVTDFEKPISDTKERIAKKVRKHKALFIDYPFLPQLSNFPVYNNYDNSNTEERTSGNGKKYEESNVYYIRLPPTPYMFVPGLGYISQPPTYSTTALRPQIGHVRPFRPQEIYQPQIHPFINLPLDFVSNGKPTSVYQWQAAAFKPLKRPDSQVSTLDKGPYFFNGRPTSLYLLRPDAQSSIHQNIQYSDYQDNTYY